MPSIELLIKSLQVHTWKPSPGGGGVSLVMPVGSTEIECAPKNSAPLCRCLSLVGHVRPESPLHRSINAHNYISRGACAAHHRPLIRNIRLYLRACWCRIEYQSVMSIACNEVMNSNCLTNARASNFLVWLSLSRSSPHSSSFCSQFPL